MKKNIILSILFFAAGFLTHAFFFPDVLINSLSDVQQVALPNVSPTSAASGDQRFMTQVAFDGEHFSKHAITMEVGSYLVITNNNKENKLMSLTSNNPLLATQRGYGESEQIKVRLDIRGDYVVADKNNPQERMKVTVK